MVIFLPFLQRLICIRWYIIKDISNIAIEDATKVVNGGGIHGFVFSEFINGGTGNVMMVDERIGCLFRIF